MECGWGGTFSQIPVPNLDFDASPSGAWDPSPFASQQSRAGLTDEPFLLQIIHLSLFFFF